MDYPKSDASVGLVDGKFTDGNPSEGIPASLDTAAWANNVTDELLNVLAEADIDPDETVTTQVRDAIKAIITAQFTGENQLLSGEGYQMFPGGLILQFVSGSGVSNNGDSITFPTTFPNAALALAVADLNSGSTATNAHVIGYHSLTTSGFTIAITSVGGSSNVSGFSCIAVGY